MNPSGRRAIAVDLAERWFHVGGGDELKGGLDALKIVGHSLHQGPLSSATRFTLETRGCRDIRDPHLTDIESW